MSISIQYTAQKNVQKRKTLNMQQNTLNKQDNVHTNTESIQCISIVYCICPYKYRINKYLYKDRLVEKNQTV